MYTATNDLLCYSRNDSYANYTTAPTEMVIQVSDNVDLDQAPNSTDAGITLYNAVFLRGEVQ